MEWVIFTATPNGWPPPLPPPSPGFPLSGAPLPSGSLAASHRLGAETKSALARGRLRALSQVASVVAVAFFGHLDHDKSIRCRRTPRSVTEGVEFPPSNSAFPAFAARSSRIQHNGRKRRSCSPV